MTGRERVRPAVRFQDPDRIPYNVDSYREPDNRHRYGQDW